MRPRIALSTLWVAALAALLHAPAAAGGPWGLARGEWYANLEASTFTANTFRSASGGRADTGLVVEQRALRWHHELGWRGRFTLLFELPAMSVTRREWDDRGDTLRVQGTTTGFQDILLGVRYQLRSGRDAVAVGLHWSAPSGYNRNLPIALGLNLGDGVPFRDTLLLDLGAGRVHRDTLTHSGDGLQELTLGFTLGMAVLRRGFAQASVGYGYRYLSFGRRSKQLADLYDYEPDNVVIDGDTLERRRIVATHVGRGLWADRLYLSADLGLWVGTSVMLGGRYRGLITVESGPLVPETSRHLAGPLVLYRLDERLDMFAGSWSTASGKNTLHFDQVYVGLAFHNTKLNRLQGFLGGKQAP